MIEINNRNEFFKLQNTLSHVPFTQSEAWYDMLVSDGTVIRCFVSSKDKPVIALWGVESKIPFFGKSIFRISGEAYDKTLDEKEIKKYYKHLANLFDAIEIDSNNKYQIDFEIGLRRAGFKRPLGSFSCPLTLENDLTGEQSRSRNWKRNVKVAEKSGLVFKRIPEIDDVHIHEFVSFFNEMALTKKMTHYAGYNEIKALLNHDSVMLYAVLTSLGNALAYRIIQTHNNYAFDIYAANSNESRNYRGGTPFMIEYIFKDLVTLGITHFDFGRIPPSNHNTDKIYEFKIAARGKKIQYNGEWSYYNSMLIEFMVLFYKAFKLKKQRY